jgi:ABC-type amino acid transport system permease subunit
VRRLDPAESGERCVAAEGIAVIMAVYLTISLSISLVMNWYNRRVALRGVAT